MDFNNTIDGFKKTLLDNKVIDMKNISCTHCNDCCTIFAMVTEEELESLKGYFFDSEEGKKILKRARNKVKRHLRQNSIYFFCPFTDDETKKCSIYNIRPKICKEFHCNRELYRKYKEFKEDNYTDGEKSLNLYYFFEDIFVSFKWKDV